MEDKMIHGLVDHGIKTATPMTVADRIVEGLEKPGTKAAVLAFKKGKYQTGALVRNPFRYLFDWTCEQLTRKWAGSMRLRLSPVTKCMIKGETQ